MRRRQLEVHGTESGLSFKAFVMAVDRVEKRLKRVCAALDAAGVRYAVIGGNAVAVWVAAVDPAATRTTKDVDLLVRKEDSDRVSQALAGLGFERHDLHPLILFTEPGEPSKRSGVHLVWADQRVQPSYVCSAPCVEEAVRSPEGFWVLNLAALVRMKLTSFRDIDRVHIPDLLGVGLIDQQMHDSLPVELRRRLDVIRDTWENLDQ